MKYGYVYVLIGCVVTGFLGCENSQDFTRTDFTRGDAIFSIQIEDPNNSYVTIKSYGVFKQVDLDDSGSFTDTLKNIVEGYYTFSDRRNASGFFIHPNSTVQVKLNTKDFIKTIEFSGDFANENTYLKQFFLLNRELSRVNSIQHLAFLDENEFKHTVDSIRDLRYDLLNNYNNKNPFDKHFLFLEQNRLLYEWANRMETYEDYRKYALQDTSFRVSDHFYDFRNKLDFENENLIVVPSYHFYMENYYQKLANAMTQDTSSDAFVNFLKVVGDQVNNSTIKEVLLHAYAMQNLSESTNMNLFVKTYNDYIVDSLKKEEVKKLFDEVSRLKPGQPAPEFNLSNLAGDTVKLSDFEGAYVYMDIWTTWCKRCMAEIPYLEMLKEKYKDANIVFVGICTDSFEENWKNFLAVNALKGVQLFAGNDKNFEYLFNASEVPRYLLINPAGNISTAVAPSPSETEHIELLFDRIAAAGER